METTQTNTEIPSFEIIRAMFKDIAEQQEKDNLEMRKRAEEFDQEVKKRAEEFDQEMKKRAEEFDLRMKENAERQAEQREIDRQEAERRSQEAERRSQEADKRAERRAEQLDKQLGKLGNRFGEMVEYMVMPNLVKKFQELGFVFTKAYPHAVIDDEKNNIVTEVDITLTNGDKVMIVEVKSKPSTEDITDHIKRMEMLRKRADMRGDKRKYLGSIAGMIFNMNEKQYALKNGFYVVEPSGETFVITEPSGDYSPKEW
jgi:exonuclease VII large subunit